MLPCGCLPRAKLLVTAPVWLETVLQRTHQAHMLPRETRKHTSTRSIAFRVVLLQLPCGLRTNAAAQGGYTLTCGRAPSRGPTTTPAATAAVTAAGRHQHPHLQHLLSQRLRQQPLLQLAATAGSPAC